jgi:hypothetical protein
MGSSPLTFQKWRIHLANDSALISIVGLTVRCKDILAGPNFVEFGFTKYVVLNTETRKWSVAALVENCTGTGEFPYLIALTSRNC